MFAVYATNQLGLPAFGRLEYYLSLVFIFTVVADFGLEQWTTREVARRTSELGRLLPNLLSLRIPFTFLAVASLFIYLRFISDNQQIGLPGTIALLYLTCFSFQTIVRGFMRGFGLMDYEALFNFIEKLLVVLLGISAIYFGFGYQVVLSAFLIANSFVLLLSFFLIRTKSDWRRGWFEMAVWPGYVKGAGLFGIAAVFITIFYRQDTILLTEIAGDEATGSYRSPYRIVEGLWMLPQMLSVTLYPVLSALHHERKDIGAICAGAFRFLIGMSLPIAVGGMLVANSLVALLFPDNTEGGIIFSALIWTTPFVYGNFLVGTILAATDRQKINLLGSVLAVAVNLGLNLWAIPRWGAVGAAMVAVVTQAIYFITMFIPVIVRHDNLKITWSLLRTLGASAAMAIMVWMLRPAGIFIQIPAGAIFYGLMAWSIGLVKIQDFKQFR